MNRDDLKAIRKNIDTTRPLNDHFCAAEIRRLKEIVIALIEALEQIVP